MLTAGVEEEILNYHDLLFMAKVECLSGHSRHNMFPTHYTRFYQRSIFSGHASKQQKVSHMIDAFSPVTRIRERDGQSRESKIKNYLLKKLASNLFSISSNFAILHRNIPIFYDFNFITRRISISMKIFTAVNHLKIFLIFSLRLFFTDFFFRVF